VDLARLDMRQGVEVSTIYYASIITTRYKDTNTKHTRYKEKLFSVIL